MLQDGLGLYHRLDELVGNLGLDWSGLLDDPGGLVAAQEELTASVGDGLLGLGGLDEGLEVTDIGLLGLSGGLEGLALLGELLDNFLALLADSDSSVLVLHQGD